MPVLARLVLGLIAIAIFGPPALAQSSASGTVTGLALPRFVSLKADTVNVRVGPHRDNDVAWIFKRAGLPVEITQEFENWRRIRDSDGAEGWVLHNLLSGRRTALVAPWSQEPTLPLFARASEGADVVARLQPRVLGNLAACTGRWCRINGQGYDGWIQQDRLWGAYPGEAFE